MTTAQKWMVGIVVAFLFVSAFIFATGFIVILPNAFDMRWQFWANKEISRAPLADDVEIPVVETATIVEEVKMPLLDCGDFGTYTPVLVGNDWEYWMEEPLKITGQYDLVDLKIKGGECKFSVPNGYIAIWNQSAGSVYIDEAKGNLGNPVKLNGSEMLTGDIVAKWAANNDSAGVMITLKENN